MAFQRVPNTVQVSIVYLQNGETMINTFYGTFIGSYTQADLDLLALNVDLTVTNFWRPLQTLDTTYVRTEVKGLDAENDFVAENNDSSGVGGDASGGLPNSVTLSIKKSSGLSGRSARGRIYWMGIPSNKLQSNENFVSASYITAVEDAVDLIRDAIDTTSSFEATLVSRFSNGVQRVLGVTFNWTSTTCVDQVVDTQRGRLSS